MGKFFNGIETEDILEFSSIEQLWPHDWLKVRNNFTSFAEFKKAGRGQLAKAGLIPSQIDVIKNPHYNSEIGLKLLERHKMKVITLDDPEYPKLLKEINDPPLWLYYQGSLEALQQPCLTVVGSRKVSNYGLFALKNILPEEIISQLCIVSGLAYGVDKAAHQLALKADGKTVAVLAGGLDDIYPSAHTNLAQGIIDRGGAIISEYPPLSRPKPYRFPVRNRIIAGLSPATLIVQATLKSGTLTTAKSALDYNRELFAIPGEITSAVAQGSNFLIKHGATLIDNCFQIRDFYALKKNKKVAVIDKELQKILDLLDDPKNIDELVDRSGLPIEQILGILTRLELGDHVFQPETGYYKARR